MAASPDRSQTALRVPRPGVPRPGLGTDWATVGLMLGMNALLVGNFFAYRAGLGPLWLHVAIATAAIHCSFTIWHEGAHRNISKRAWLNDGVAILGILPYMAPFYLERWLHLQHHAKLNREEDPNRLYTAGPFWQMPLRYLQVPAYLREKMREDPRSSRERLADRLALLVVPLLYGIALWQGAFLDLVALWFVPFALSKVVMDWYINYLPHVGLAADRFRGTRILDLGWFTPLVLCHNYHAIHHLWPGLPWHRYRAVFREKLDYLREHGVPIEYRIVGFHRPLETTGNDSPAG